jgi:hypothetical protein
MDRDKLHVCTAQSSWQPALLRAKEARIAIARSGADSHPEWWAALGGAATSRGELQACVATTSCSRASIANLQSLQLP